MSAKNRDEYGRWRSRTIAFRVSPEEDAQINALVAMSGLTKQDYITNRLCNRDVVVVGNPRVCATVQCGGCHAGDVGSSAVFGLYLQSDERKL